MPRKRITTTRVRNVLQDAPSVYLADIEDTDIKQRRLIKLLNSYGIATTDQLKKLEDAELIDQNLFGPLKLEKLVEFLTLWKENGYPVKAKENITQPESIIEVLQKKVFLNYKNLEILAMRWNLKTYEEIAEHFNQSRQSINVKEHTTYQRFVKWYEENEMFEKIGNYDEFRKYCEQNFPADQRTILDASRRLVSLSK